MALPKNIRPEYSTTIPSNGKKIKYQPFSVREEKVLILAAESGDMDEISNAITNVLGRCITHPSDVKVSDLALFDIEYLFLKARAKSAGETIKLKVKDPNDPECEVEHSINIDSIRIEKNKDHNTLIDIADNITVRMKYPGVAFFAEGLQIDNIAESMGTVSKCISQIIVDEEVYNYADMSKEEIVEWLEDLTTEQFTKIMGFFNTMPKLKHKFKLKNKSKGTDFEIVLEGLADFF